MGAGRAEGPGGPGEDGARNTPSVGSQKGRKRQDRIPRDRPKPGDRLQLHRRKRVPAHPERQISNYHRTRPEWDRSLLLLTDRDGIVESRYRLRGQRNGEDQRLRLRLLRMHQGDDFWRRRDTTGSDALASAG